MLFHHFDPDMKATTTTAPSSYEEHKPLLFHQQYFNYRPGGHHQPASPHEPGNPSVESRPAGKPQKREGGGGGDGSSVEVIRRPRGRPPGSKNKPKASAVVARDAPDRPEVMRPHVLEIPAGRDVAAALNAFCRRRDLGLSVLSATGSLSNLTLRQPDPALSPAATFRGRFEILSISATIFPPSAAATTTGGGFSVTVAGPHGRVVGGVVAGPMVAAGTITLVAAAFSSSSFSRMPVEEKTPAAGDDQLGGRGSGGGGGSIMAVESSGMPVSSGHLLSDVIWAPTARQPPPY